MDSNKRLIKAAERAEYIAVLAVVACYALMADMPVVLAFLMYKLTVAMFNGPPMAQPYPLHLALANGLVAITALLVTMRGNWEILRSASDVAESDLTSPKIGPTPITTVFVPILLRAVIWLLTRIPRLSPDEEAALKRSLWKLK